MAIWASGTGGSRADTDPPSIRVTPGLAGQAAVTALGGNIDALAERYLLTGAQLRDWLLSDPALRVDRGGALYAVGLPQLGDLPRWSAPAGDGRDSPGPADKLHSKPGAPYQIYLDFDGADLSETIWKKNGVDTLVAPAFSLGDAASTDTMIKYVWQRVAEDFATFNVDVTTEAGSKPAAVDSRATVVVTPGLPGFCRCSTSVYVDEFGNDDAPILIFTDSLNKAREKSIAEAISQSLGRSLGLGADGVRGGDGRAAAARYGGAGIGKSGWAPIMGDGTYKELTQFSRGDYPGASNRQDDFARIQFRLDLRPDDAGNDTAQAYSLSPVTTLGRAQASFDGVLGVGGDIDVFGLYAGQGAVSVTLSPRDRGGNTDLKLSLLDINGAVLQTSDPANDTAASITANLPGGTYFLKVEGGAAANPYGNTGYYRLTASYPPNSPTAPVAAIKASTLTGVAPLRVDLDGTGSTDDGQIVGYRWSFSDAEPSSAQDSDRNPPTTWRTFRAPGAYEVRLAVTDNSGNSSFTTQTIVVTPGAEPADDTQASISSYQLGSNPLRYQFAASTPLRNWGVGTYFWNFGGEWIPVIGSNYRYTYVFPGPGAYTVQLVARDQTGTKFSTGESQVVIPGTTVSTQAASTPTPPIAALLNLPIGARTSTASR